MDMLDKKIVCILENNCRTPISHIAKKLRKNRNVIKYRIDNLKKDKVIQKYITSINLGKLGYTSYKIYFQIYNNTEIINLINYLKNKKDIIHLIKLEGEYNLSCVVITKNILELNNLLTNIKNMFGKFLRGIYVSIVVYSKIYKFEKLLLNNKNKSIKVEKYSSKEELISLDKIDKIILKELSQNANLSYIELMNKTGYTLDIIKYRMKKLKKNIISSFRLLFDLNKFGYFHYVILIETNNMKKNDEEKLVSWTSMKNNIMYCSKRIGKYDFEINVAIKNINELRDFLNELEVQFSEIIFKYRTIIVNKILKLNYAPF